MAKNLNLYKDEDLLETAPAEESGTTKVTIPDLTSDTNYPKGTYTVAWENDTGESAKIDVPAFDTTAIAVASIALNKEALTLNPDDVDELNVTFTPSNADNKKVTFKSDNEEVVSVDNEGNIAALAEGVANITATSEDGNKTASCKVTVEIPVPEEPTEVNVTPSKTTAEISVSEAE